MGAIFRYLQPNSSIRQLLCISAMKKYDDSFETKKLTESPSSPCKLTLILLQSVLQKASHITNPISLEDYTNGKHTIELQEQQMPDDNDDYVGLGLTFKLV